MCLKRPDFNLRQNRSNSAIAVSNRIKNWQSKMNRNILMLNSITLIDQRSILVKKRCSADCSSAEHSRSASSGRAVALPRNLIAVPRAGFTTARVRRYRSPISLVHAKGRAGEIQQLDVTTQQEVEEWLVIKRVFPEYFQSTNIGAAALKEPFSHFIFRMFMTIY